MNFGNVGVYPYFTNKHRSSKFMHDLLHTYCRQKAWWG